jgi:hypothetical protein
MKRPGFFEGVGVALITGIGGGMLFGTLTSIMATGFVLRLLIAAVSGVYLLYLLRRSEEKVGRITTLTAWILISAVIGLLDLGLPLYLAIHLGLLWLIRSLYFHASLISAFTDLGLVAIGLAAALWAIFETGNLFLGLWSFFLVQALFAAIPSDWKKSRNPDMPGQTAPDPFMHARRIADEALRKLSI